MATSLTRQRQMGIILESTRGVAEAMTADNYAAVVKDPGGTDSILSLIHI